MRQGICCFCDGRFTHALIPHICAAGSAPGTHGRAPSRRVRWRPRGPQRCRRAHVGASHTSHTRRPWLPRAAEPVRTAGPRAATCCSKAASGTRCPDGASSCPTYAPGTSAAAALALPAGAAASRARAAPRRRSIAACAAATKKYAGRASRCGVHSPHRQRSREKGITSLVTAAHMPCLSVHAFFSNGWAPPARQQRWAHACGQSPVYTKQAHDDSAHPQLADDSYSSMPAC